MNRTPDLAWLRARTDPRAGALYALLDCAREPRLHAWIRAETAPHQCLFSGVQALRLERYGPWCVELHVDSPLLGRWLDQGSGWMQHWGWMFQSTKSLPSVVRHLRRFLQVQAQGRPLYWRFYDPRVFCLTLPELNVGQQAEFFGDCIQRVFCFDHRHHRVVEAWQQSSLLERALTGLRRVHVRLHEPQSLPLTPTAEPALTGRHART
ncbi:MAG: DUF4123 domain-containing protein [Aquimonas sp.]|nr:DUF4123 domain-containing protein [Aquimonas sp.]